MDFPARYWQILPDGKMQCDLCPRYCRLKDGQRGLCFVRKREGDQMLLTTYGRSSGFCIDPIEKKPLNHFYPGTPILSFGTAGCNLACKFCQNWDISKAREMDRLMDQATPAQIAITAKRMNCKSVAFTYNDPVIFLEYAVDIAKACKDLGIKTVAVTAGFITEDARGEFFSHMDAANVDLKAFTQKFYKKVCAGDLKPVLDTLIYLKKETDTWFEITNLIIPNQNDSDEELYSMVAWILDNIGPDVPLHFTAFHPDYRMVNEPRTPSSTLENAREIALREGLNFVYTGNVHDKSGSSTYCKNCDKILIGRDWYVLSDWNLDNKGNCNFCGTPCPGNFEGPAGNWGARRQPVRIGGF